MGRLTAWDGPMSVPVTCSHGGGRDNCSIIGKKKHGVVKEIDLYGSEGAWWMNGVRD